MHSKLSNSTRHGQSLALAALLSLAGCAAAPPANLRGVNGGRLEPCPSAPHCVSSQAGDPDKKVAPLQIAGDQDAIRSKVVAAVQSLPRTEIVVAKGDYVHATFTSHIFGFVDDVEFVIHDGGKVDVRSSSRIGYYDFGVNRGHIAAIRKQLQSGS